MTSSDLPGSEGVRSPASAGVSARMSAHPRRDTGPEMALRRALHARGLRYRVQTKVPGNNRRTVDIAFPRARLAVFMDGCFWHGCPEHSTTPKNNREWWLAKIAANRARDEDTDQLLSENGWTVLRIWEHEAVAVAADRVTAELQD